MGGGLSRPACVRRPRLLLHRALATGFSLLLAACGDAPKQAPSAATSANSGGLQLLSWDLQDYAWQDRDRGGQPDDFKPREECAIILAQLHDSQADTLLLRGIGSEAAAEQLQRDLGSHWKLLYIPCPRPLTGIAILGQPPWTDPRVYDQLVFRIGGREQRASLGGITRAGWRIHHASIPDEASYEARRNHARLIAQTLQPVARGKTPLLLSIGMPDAPDSPVGRYLRDIGLHLLLPADDRGDCWTCKSDNQQGYAFNQLLWVNSNALARIDDCRIEDHPALRGASRCRPQLLHGRSAAED